ncbi:MAG TPA: LLM class flavin-dependent oxidoreductase [Candidatus Binatia bacterium]|nr:LLM class flavin-dependent oxidoreductase [Candidatus Binatia bacterium]
MKFDLLYELQMPKPHDERSEYRCYHEALAQIELADRLGYDTVWEVEHHFLTEFAHSSAPEVFLAAVAQRTSRIRLGHGVVLLPSRFNHPIRVAERVAALDLISDGRVEFGTGRSSQYEQAGFEIDTEASREMWQESLEMIPRMWTEDPFEWKGRFTSVPPRSIVPKPLQKPHPPIWMAATSPQSWEIAGRNGIGILGLTIFVSVPQLEDRIRAYRAALRDARPVGRFVNDRVGAFTIVHVAETREQAIANGGAEAAINYLLYAFRVLGGFADPSGRGMQRDYADLEIKSTPYRDLIAKEYPIIVKMQRGECTFEDLDAEDMVIVGDVDQCIRKVERYRQAGLDHLIALMQVDRIPHDRVMRSIELFAKEVMPRFRDAR